MRAKPRERGGITPEEVFDRPSRQDSPPPAPPAALIPAHDRDVTDRLKAAERCVLAVTEALTGEKHDGIYDYDQACEHLLSRIAIVGLDGTVMLDPKDVDVATFDGLLVGYRYHGALPCPAPSPADPVE